MSRRDEAVMASFKPAQQTERSLRVAAKEANMVPSDMGLLERGSLTVHDTKT